MMGFVRGADAEKKPEAEALLHEEQGHTRRRTEPVIPPAADLYPATEQAHHVRNFLMIASIETGTPSPYLYPL